MKSHMVPAGEEGGGGAARMGAVTCGTASVAKGKVQEPWDLIATRLSN